MSEPKSKHITDEELARIGDLLEEKYADLSRRFLAAMRGGPEATPRANSP
jgi:hypothetical protein